jgi:hypothetical protein
VPSSVRSQDVAPLIEDYVAKAGGDQAVALELMAKDLLILTWNQEATEHRQEILDQNVQFLANKIKREEPSLLDRLGNSSLFKVSLFAFGVYVGVQAGE